MVILDLALLTAQNDIYTSSEVLNLSYLQQSLNELEAKYGKEFMSIVQIMSEPDEQRRLDWVQLEEFVKKVDNTAPRVPLMTEIIQIESRQQTPTGSQHGYQVFATMPTQFQPQPVVSYYPLP